MVNNTTPRAHMSLGFPRYGEPVNVIVLYQVIWFSGQKAI